jgi:hypothetical protein
LNCLCRACILMNDGNGSTSIAMMNHVTTKFG